MSNHQSDISDFQMGETVFRPKKGGVDFEFTDVYHVYDFEENIQFLYDMLKERPKCCYISHRKMPTFEQHVRFVRSRPYSAWYMIRMWLDNPWQGMETGEGEGTILDRVGNIYLTDHNELGIFILKKYQGRGIAKAALKAFMALHKGPFLANINPANEGSIRLFTEKLGFKHIQNTYRSA